MPAGIKSYQAARAALYLRITATASSYRSLSLSISVSGGCYARGCVILLIVGALVGSTATLRASTSSSIRIGLARTPKSLSLVRLSKTVSSAAVACTTTETLRVAPDVILLVVISCRSLSLMISMAVISLTTVAAAECSLIGLIAHS
jgi:hypothetical protein